MDDYAKFYYAQLGKTKPDDDVTKISSRVELRKNLECASFKWYLDNVYPELDVPNNFAEGYVTNEALSNTTCLDTSMSDTQPSGEVSFYSCHNKGGTQFFELTKNNEVRHHAHCLEPFGEEVKLFNCHKGKESQEWLLNVTLQQLIHKVTQKCLSVDIVKKNVIVETCDPSNVNHRWNFQYVYLEKYS